jgi:hypothetical protein
MGCAIHDRPPIPLPAYHCRDTLQDCPYAYDVLRRRFALCVDVWRLQRLCSGPAYWLLPLPSTWPKSQGVPG